MDWLEGGDSRFSGMDPDELVRFQRGVVGDERFDLLDVVQEYVQGGRGLRYRTKLARYSVVKSFFEHNRASLPRDVNFRVRSGVRPVVGSLDVDDVHDVVLSSNRLYQAIFLCMFQGALDRRGFEYWNLNGWDELEESLDGKPLAHRVELPGRKRFRNVKPFYTFIGGDALDAVHRYLPDRPDGVEAIFITRADTPVNEHTLYVYWTRHMREIGKIPRAGDNPRMRYGKNPHEMRDVFRSQWEKSPAKWSVAEFCMGHVTLIDPNEYNKAYRDESWALGEYLKALPLLQIMSEREPYGLVKEVEVAKLRRELQQVRGRLDKHEALSTVNVRYVSDGRN